MYNKKVLSDAMKNLASRKAPAKKKDTVVNNNKLLPFISSEGYKQGPPPAGTNYRIPSDTIYNPTPYNIRAVGSNGEEKFIAAGDTRNHKFNGAKYVDEYQAQYGKIIYVDDPNDPRLKIPEYENIVANSQRDLINKLKSSKSYDEYNDYWNKVEQDKIIKSAYNNLLKLYKQYNITPRLGKTVSKNAVGSLRPVLTTNIYKYQDPIAFTPPEITDVDWTDQIPIPEDQVIDRNTNLRMDVEQREPEPKTYTPEFKRQYRHDPRNFSNLWGLKPRYGHWVDVPVEADGGDISIPDLNQYEDGGEYDLTDDQIAELKKGGYVVEELPKKKNSKKYSRSLLATNQLFAQNPLLKKQKSKKRKIFDPNAKYYQDGGAPYNISGPISEQDEIQEYTPVLKPKAYGHEPEDYSQFQNFAQSLPSNLQDPGYQYGNPDQYDLYGMWRTVGKPASFTDVQDTDYFPLQPDGTYNGFSVADDGTLLKPMSHHTTWKEVMNSQLNTNPYFKENRLIKNEQGRLQYVPNKQKGGTKTQYYTYAGSKNKYKKVGNQWYISNEGTAFDFVPIKDPTGSRTKELNKHAKIDPYPWIPSKSFERKINTVLGDPMGASGRAGEYYAPEDEDDVDNIRHTYSGYRTAKGIADATGNIPYVSNPLGYIGSSILGAAHEVGTMFSDPRSWGTVLSEAAEDQANNIRGAGMVFNQQSPARTVKNIAQMSRQGLLPDGYAPGTWGPDYVDPYDLRQQEKAFRQSTGKPTPVSLTEKFDKGGFQDDINKRRKLLRDWTYGASIGMLQKAQVGLETRGTEEQPKELPEIRAVDPNDEVTQLMKARRDELSYAKNDRQKKRVSQRYDKLIAQAKERREKRREDEDEGNVLTGPKTGKQVEQETLASGNLSPRAAQRIEKANRRRSQWETAEDKRITREDEERKRQALKESIDTSIDSGIGTSTYVDTPKLGDPFGRLEGENIIDVDERVGKQNQEAFVKYLVDASNKKVYGQGAGAIEQVTTPAEQYIKSIGLGNLLNEHSAYAILQDLMYQDPEGTAKGLEEAKYKVWQKSEQAAYDKMDPFWQVMNNLGALAADPLYYGEQTIKGERSLVGQGQRSVAPEYYEDAKYYDKALGDKGDLNALLNLFNPMAYGAAAGEDALRGKYGDAAVNALQGVLAGASGAGIAKGTTAGFKALNKSRAIFNPITGKATGYTVNPAKLLNTSILAEGVARDMDYTSPESTLYMADKLISGDKTWNESAAGLADNMLNYIGMKSTVDDIVSGWKEGGREALRVPAAAILKRWDKPLFSLTVPSLSNTLKQPTFGKGVKSLSNFRIGTRTPAVWNPETARYQVIGPRKIGQTNIAASDIARGMTFSGSISAGIGAYNSVNNAIDVVGSDDATFGEKYKAIKDAGYKTTGALIQAMAVPRVFRPIYSSPYVNAYFATNYYDELLKGDLSKNPNPLRGVFSTSRLIAHKKGGETYEIDNNTRRVLAKLGYQVEDID